MHLVKTILTAGLLLSAAAQAHNVLEFPQPENNPEEFYAVTEIPTGGIIKYETDAKTGFIVADRFQSMPVAYPANYGSLTQSLAGDGDPLDVVFYTRAPMAPGTLIKLRAIGVLKMIDGGEKDDKIIAVPASKIDPTYDDIKTISDLPKIEQQRLEAFFRVYKELPEGRKKVELAGFNDAAAAKQEIKSAWEAWKAKNPQYYSSRALSGARGIRFHDPYGGKITRHTSHDNAIPPYCILTQDEGDGCIVQPFHFLNPPPCLIPP